MSPNLHSGIIKFLVNEYSGIYLSINSLKNVCAGKLSVSSKPLIVLSQLGEKGFRFIGSVPSNDDHEKSE